MADPNVVPVPLVTIPREDYFLRWTNREGIVEIVAGRCVHNRSFAPSVARLHFDFGLFHQGGGNPVNGLLSILQGMFQAYVHDMFERDAGLIQTVGFNRGAHFYLRIQLGDLHYQVSTEPQQIRFMDGDVDDYESFQQWLEDELETIQELYVENSELPDMRHIRWVQLVIVGAGDGGAGALPAYGRRVGCPDLIHPEFLLRKSKAIAFCDNEQKDFLCAPRALLLSMMQWYAEIHQQGFPRARRIHDGVPSSEGFYLKGQNHTFSIKTYPQYQNFRKKRGEKTRARLALELISGIVDFEEVQKEGGLTHLQIRKCLTRLSKWCNKWFNLNLYSYTPLEKIYPMNRLQPLLTDDLYDDDTEPWVDKEDEAHTFNAVVYQDHIYPIMDLNKLAPQNMRFCDGCQSAYYHRGSNKDHGCPVCNIIKCGLCKSRETNHVGPDADWKYAQVCAGCKRSFPNPECFSEHMKKVCEKIHKCDMCGENVACVMKDKQPTYPHTCGRYECRGCGEEVDTPHYCYIKPPQSQLKKLVKSPLTVGCSESQAIELLRDEIAREEQIRGENKLIRLNNARLADGEQKEKLLPQNKHYSKWKQEYQALTSVVVYADYECVQDNEEKSHSVNMICSMANDGEVLQEFQEVRAWLEYLFQKYPQGGTIIFHNGSGYDFHFTIAPLKDMQYEFRSWCVSGNRIKYFQVQPEGKHTWSHTGGWRFIDSFAFISIPLSNFGKTFGLTVEKGYFPHLANTNKNQTNFEVPPLEAFGINHMSDAQIAELKEWREKRAAEGPWVLKEELIKYCRLDVRVLKEGCEKFVKIIKEITATDTAWGITPFDDYTMPSTARRLWNMYCNIGQDGEHARLPRLPLTIHQKLMPAMCGGRTGCVKQLWEHRDGYPYAQYVDFTSLYPWVNKYCRYPIDHPVLVEGKGEEDDLYTCDSILESLTLFARDQPCDDVLGYDDLVLAVLEVDVVCPQDLYLPFLHEKMTKDSFAAKELKTPHAIFTGGKLMFDLTPKYNQLYTSIELAKALKLGYKITKVHRAYVWEHSHKGLFAPYINKFLKLKQQAAGWPREDMSEDEKRAYIREYDDNEGILLDYDQIGKNPGMYATAKKFLNSLWGKFTQRIESEFSTKELLDGTCNSDLRKWSELTRGYGFEDYDFPERAEGNILKPGFIFDVNDIEIISDRYLLVRYRYNELAMHEQTTKKARHPDPYQDPIHKQHLTLNQCAQVGIYTTAYARMKLYSVLEKLGDRVLYYDTDSVIFAPRKGEDNTATMEALGVGLGRYLGDLTSEIGDSYAYDFNNGIVKFLSAGPKHYAYQLTNGKIVRKVKGLSLRDRDVDEKVTLDSMEAAIRNGYQVETKMERLQADGCFMGMNTVEIRKVYRAVCTKRRPLPYKDGVVDTVPWRDCAEDKLAYNQLVESLDKKKNEKKGSKRKLDREDHLLEKRARLVEQ